MGSDCPKNQRVFRQLKGETIFHSNRALPSISCPLYQLYPKGRMGRVLQKELQLLIKGFLNLLRQIIIFFFEPLAELAILYSFSHFNPSSADSNLAER